MEEFTAHALVNRNDPVPIISFDGNGEFSGDEGEMEADSKDGRRRGVKKHLSKSNLKDRFRKATGKGSESGTSIQDRLLEKLLQQVIPVEDLSKSREAGPSSTAQSYAERPAFNITTMSNNFRRFNSRIGVVFLFQARMMRLLSWKTWPHTISFLAVYTFVCLDPYLLSVVPLATLLLGIFIPSFIARHPAPPSAVPSNAQTYSMTGPPNAPAPIVRPVKELSKDFFRNMRDLQNSMEDFSRVHDKVITVLTPPTNFSNEPLSSTLFLFLFISGAFMFLASHLIPWRLIFLLAGWFITCACHPNMQKMMISTHKEHIVPREEQVKSWLGTWIAHDIILDSEPETREVEIFELQKLTTAGEWESWVFSPTPYDPLSHARIADERPKGTRFFEDVQAPKGWEWSEKKWTLDLWSREWVEERIITGVEVETEGERWVYDIEYEKGGPKGVVNMPLQGKGKSRPLPSWEDGGVSRKRGEWRRRRWVRMVKRKTFIGATEAQ